MTLDRRRAAEVDLLGHLYLLLRSDTAKRARGEFYTPPAVAKLMAEMSFAGLSPGQAICDPTAGTGGLLRAAAEALRGAGKDPHDFAWYACDIEPVVVAGLVVNAHVWDLGPRVVIGCADSLAEPDWGVRAIEEQQEAIAAQRSRMIGAALLAALRMASCGGASS